jgi:HK97 gp10 family phage protein
MNLEGIDTLKKYLTSIILKADEVQQAATPVADMIKDKMKTNAPKVSGEFAATIGVYAKKNGMGKTVGAKYGGKSKGNIAHLLEYGHVARDGKTFVPGTGFIQKTWMEVKSKAEKDMIANLEKKITQNFNG